jgi:ankyrin repeat protein
MTIKCIIIFVLISCISIQSMEPPDPTDDSLIELYQEGTLTEDQILELLPILLNLGADYNACDSLNRSVLRLAFDARHYRVVHWLLTRGVDVTTRANDGDTVLLAAITRRQRLRATSCKKEFEELYNIIVRLIALHASSLQRAPLFRAIRMHAVDVIDVLLEQEINLNVYVNGLTPLLDALHHGYFDIALRLVQAGADVNYVHAQTGYTALHSAIIQAVGRYKHNDEYMRAHIIPFITELIERGAIIDAPDNQWQTPLHIATAHNAHELVAVLVAAGALPTVRDNGRRSPLSVALAMRFTSLLELFVQRYPALLQVPAVALVLLSPPAGYLCNGIKNK